MQRRFATVIITSFIIIIITNTSNMVKLHYKYMLYNTCVQRVVLDDKRGLNIIFTDPCEVQYKVISWTWELWAVYSSSA